MNYAKHIGNAAGFSLIELVVVVVVIGILATVAMNSMTSGLDDLRRVKTEREMDLLSNAIVGDPSAIASGKRSDFGYIGDIGAFPPNLTALIQNPGGYATWNGPYLAPGFVQDTAGYKTDAWGKSYTYSGGPTITSSGSGSTITKKIADAASDYLSNTYRGEVRDSFDSLPGAIYAESVTVAITVPNGSGGTATTSVHPDGAGAFAFNALPVGVHPMRIVYEPNADTLTRYLTILPRHKSDPPDIFYFATAYFGPGAPVVCGGYGADTLRPTGTGTINELNTSGCAVTWQCVDDVTPDYNSTYAESDGTSWDTDLYETAEPTDTSCTVSRVTVYAVARKFVKDADIRTAIGIDDDLYEGSSRDLDDSYETFSTSYSVNPATGTDWTWQDVITLEVGVSLRASKSTHPARCTAVWVVVEYGN